MYFIDINNEKGVIYKFVYTICNYDKFLIILCLFRFFKERGR